MVRMGIFVAAIACLTTYEWNQYHSHILRFYSWDLSRRDAVLSVASLVAKTLVMVLPFIAAGYVLKRHHRHRLGNAIDAVVPLGIFLWLFLDVKIQTMTGQHVSYYLARLASSGQLKMVGAPHRLIIPLLLPVVGLAAFAGIIWALIAWFPKRHGDDNAEKSKDLVTPWFLVVGAGCVLSLLIARRSVDNSAVLESLYGALPTAAFFFHPGSVGDQGRGTFGDDVQQLFEPLGGRFFNVSRLGSVAEFETEHSDVDRPHVILLILESFRNESISEQRMPKVAQWAKGGLVANRH